LKDPTTRISEIAEINTKEIPEPKGLKGKVTHLASIKNGTGEII
jgi:hypothetical protein